MLPLQLSSVSCSPLHTHRPSAGHCPRVSVALWLDLSLVTVPYLLHSRNSPDPTCIEPMHGRLHGMPGGCGHSSEEMGQPSELDQILYSHETPFAHLTHARSVFMLKRVRGYMRVRRHSANGNLPGYGETMDALVLGASEGDLKCLLTGAVQRCHLPSCPLNPSPSR